ncbi:MAG: HD domain-containing protein [Bacteroidales bacterium]|nr:HD domain-containing protein [Bacteroidales bacterium]
MNTKQFSDQDKTDIKKAYDALIQSISETMTPDEIEYVRKAYDLCCEKFGESVMDSGRPVVLHALNVAQIAYSELGMRSKTVVSALLHNITRYTDVTFDEIKTLFGDRVALILNDLEKVMGLDMTHISTQSDTFRKLFLSIIDDIRVVMLILAHCLDSCRNKSDIECGVIEYDSADSHEVIEKKRLAKFFDEVKYIIIPIVHRLGLYKIKQEFEEALMIYENPREFYEIKEKIILSRDMQVKKMETFLKPIRQGLVENGYDTTIKWRTKSVPSIFAKMKAQDVPFEKVYDLFAVRIIINNPRKSIFDERSDCWKVYAMVTSLYKPNEKRMRDWITVPKASGYESLHATVEDGTYNVEVQIRTLRMDDNAERGTASHWLYKAGNDKHQTADEWLNQIREIIEMPEQEKDNNAFDSSLAKKGKADKIFIITPQGDVKQLPVGSTILDFAFEVHTQVGCHCIGARVNGKMQPIRYVLNNGDRVEIQTSKKQVPKADWLNYVNTEKSKGRIKRYLKDQEMKEAELGSSIFHRKLKNWKIEFNDKIFSDLLKKYDCGSGIEFYHKIATDRIDLAEMKAFILSFYEEKESHQDRVEDDPKKEKPVGFDDDVMTIGTNISGMAFKMAKCCNPIQGDDVVGFINVGGVISIHRTNCHNFIAIRKRYPYRVVDVKWQNDSAVSRASFKITAKDNFGILSDITEVMKQMEINIVDAKMGTKNGLYEGHFVVQISNTGYLEQLLRRLREVRGVIEVQRND